MSSKELSTGAPRGVTMLSPAVADRLAKRGGPVVDFKDLPKELQGEYLEDLSRGQLCDLSETIRNTHVSALMQHDMNTWAAIADKVELHRDILAEKLKEAETVRDAAIADLQAAERSARRAWNLARGAVVLAVVGMLAGWLL